MIDSKQNSMTWKPLMLLFIVIAASVAATNILYLIPRYGGIFPYFLGPKAAGSMLGQTEGGRDSLAAAVQLYYSDSDGKFPQSLDSLFDRNYISPPLPRENVFIEVSSGKFKRAHWLRDSDRVKFFNSRAEADDTGGWGYVADPESPEWGTVFVNCTHNHFKKNIPWNLSAAPAPRPTSEAGSVTAPASE